jgi:hypothetical protein
VLHGVCELYPIDPKLIAVPDIDQRLSWCPSLDGCGMLGWFARDLREALGAVLRPTKTRLFGGADKYNRYNCFDAILI